jgi:hypothetical protein
LAEKIFFENGNSLEFLEVVDTERNQNYARFCLK